jgi:hypothetical protein
LRGRDIVSYSKEAAVKRGRVRDGEGKDNCIDDVKWIERYTKIDIRVPK